MEEVAKEVAGLKSYFCSKDKKSKVEDRQKVSTSFFFLKADKQIYEQADEQTDSNPSSRRQHAHMFCCSLLSPVLLQIKEATQISGNV